MSAEQTPIKRIPSNIDFSGALIRRFEKTGRFEIPSLGVTYIRQPDGSVETITTEDIPVQKLSAQGETRPGVRLTPNSPSNLS